MTALFTLDASDRRTLSTAFGTRGLDLTHFPTRTARHRANNGLEKELYVLRRYLFSMEAAGALSYPLKLVKSETPDFIGVMSGASYGIEVTEATKDTDQREMTLSERSSEPSLLGTYGGRYLGGIRYDGNPRGRLPDRDLTSDVVRAVRRKRRLPYPAVGIDLLIYANGNAAMMADLETTLPLLRQRLDRWGDHLTTRTKVTRVAIVKDNEQKLLIWSRAYGLRALDLHAKLD